MVCPRCGYDIRNLHARRCPECGLESKDNGAAHHCYVWWILLFVSIALMATSLISRPHIVDRWVWFNRIERLEDRCQIGDLVVEGYSVVYNGFANPHRDVAYLHLGYQLKIRRSNTQVFSRHFPELNTCISNELNGWDFSGDFVGEIVVRSLSYSGTTYTFINPITFECTDFSCQGPEEPMHINPPTGTAAIRCFADGIFTCSEGSTNPAPAIVLRLHHGQFVPDADLMRQPPPPLDSLDAQADDICAHFPDEYGSEWGLLCETGLVTPMLDLVFSGHPDLADAFFDQACPRDFPARNELRSAFQHQLRESSYWSTIVSLAPEYWHAKGIP